MNGFLKIIVLSIIILPLSSCAQITQEANSEKLPEHVFLQDGDSYNLSAEVITKEINDKKIEMFGYNGSVPGPFINTTQGSTITINFTNNTPVENTVHPHGIRLKNEFDGVPDVTQSAVQPGESFTYEITFPDAGTYWYHPHVREDLTQELGLYGNFIVKPQDESFWNPVNQEVALFVDDILMNANGVEPFDTKLTDHALMGRFGNIMLVNGDDNFEMEFKKGEIIRFAFTNSANVRPFKLSIPGAHIKLVGSDGGRYENEKFVDSLIISPSERFLIEVFFENSGKYELTHTTPKKTYKMGTFNVSEEKINNDLSSNYFTLKNGMEDVRSIIPSLETYFDKAPDKSVTLTIGMNMMGEANKNEHRMGAGMMMMDNNEMSDMMGEGANKDREPEGIEWEDDMSMMNIMSTNEMLTWKIVDNQTKNENMDIDWRFNKGDFVKIRIFNDPDSMHPMQHPIHFHGQRFVILSRNGVKEDNLVWKDTTLVKTGEVVDILVEMSNPGEWMSHCHIAEHLHSDMMFGFTVK